MRDKRNEILIFSYRIAKDLIRNGFVVKDIRPNHEVENATIVVFEGNEGARSYLREKWNIRS